MIKKIIIIILSFLVCLNVIFILFIELYKNDLIDWFKEKINANSDFHINFSEVTVNPWSFFPVLSINIRNPEVLFIKQSKEEKILSAKELNVKFHFTLFFSNALILKSLYVSDGCLLTNESLIDWFYDSSARGGEETNLEINQLNLRNFTIVYKSTSDFNLAITLEKGSINGILSSSSSRLNIEAISDSIKYNNGMLVGLDRRIKFKGAVIINNDILSVTNLFISYSDQPIIGGITYNFEKDLFDARLTAAKINLLKHRNLIKNYFGVNLKKGLADFDFKYNTNFSESDYNNIVVDFRVTNSVLGPFRGKDINLSLLSGQFIYKSALYKSRINIHKLALTTNGAKINGSLKVVNLNKPNCLFDGSFYIPQNFVLEFSPIYKFNLTGDIKTIFQINDLKNPQTIKLIKIDSKASFTDAEITSDDPLTGFCGAIILKDNSLESSFKGLVNKSNLSGKLFVHNVLDVFNYSSGAKVDLSVSSDHLDLQNISKVNFSNNPSSLEKTAKPQISIRGDIKKLTFKEADIANVAFSAKYTDSQFLIDPLIFSTCGGHFKGSVRLTNKLDVKIVGDINQMDIKELSNILSSSLNMKNDGQQIRGRLSCTFNLGFNYDSVLKNNYSGLNLESTIEVKGGKILNIKHFANIATLTKLKEVENLEFEKLSNKIFISKNQITIPEMEINNNVLNLKISGNYKIYGDYAFYLNFRLSELLARHYRSRNPEESYYIDEANRTNLFIKVIGNKDDYRIEYDTKKAFNSFKNNIANDTKSIKQSILEDFKIKKNSLPEKNNVDTLGNKSKKTTFIIEWEEFDTTQIR